MRRLFLGTFLDKASTEDTTFRIVRPFEATVIEVDQRVFQRKIGDDLKRHIKN